MMCHVSHGYDNVVVEDDVNNTIIPHYVVIVGVVLLKLT